MDEEAVTRRARSIYVMSGLFLARGRCCKKYNTGLAHYPKKIYIPLAYGLPTYAYSARLRSAQLLSLRDSGIVAYRLLT